MRTNRIESLTKAELRDQNERLRARLAEVEKRLEEETAGIGRALAKLPGVPIREQLEQALRESQTLLQAVLDSSPDAVYVKDRESRMLMANRTVLRNIGKPVDQVLGHRASEYYDTETGRPIREHDLRVLESGQVETVEETIPTQNGPRIFLSRKAPYRNAAGEIVGVLGISTDITDLKRVQESLRDRNAVLDGINRILASALDCETEEALARACLQVAMETTGSRFGFLGDINARGEVENLAVVHPGGGHQAPVLGGGGPVPGFHLRGHLGEQLAGGKGFFANNHAVPAHPMGFPSEHPSLPAFLAVPLVQGGKTTGVIGLGSRPGGFRQQDLETAEALAAAVVEVLTHLRAELAGRAAEQRFWQAQKLESLGLLAGGVAHDFNNLLVSILGNASIVRDMLPEDNPAGRYLDAVIGAGEQAATLTRQMLAYAGRGHFAVESISLSDLVRETMPLARASTDKRIRFDLETASNLPRLEADRGQMEQVLLNLVFNAAEAIGDSEGTIFIRTGPKTLQGAHAYCHPAFDCLPPGNYVSLEVRDNGCGMDEATIARIFDPFYSTKFTGRGLGLAAVAGILRYHKGSAIVKSAPGTGSSLEVLFPIQEHHPEPARTLESPGTVLVVERDELVRGMAGLALEQQGYEVLAAAGGAEALELLKSHSGGIATMVLDAGAVGTGDEVSLTELRAAGPGIAIVIAAEWSESEGLEFVRGQGIAAVIRKPYTATGLLDAVRVASHKTRR